MAELKQGSRTSTGKCGVCGLGNRQRRWRQRARRQDDAEGWRLFSFARVIDRKELPRSACSAIEYTEGTRRFRAS